MTDRDGFDEVFHNISAFGGERLPERELDDAAFGAIRQLEDELVVYVDDELILGDDYVTYLLFARDIDLEGFSLVPLDNEIEVTSGTLKFRRALKTRVDGEDVQPEYRNGVLSVRLKRILEHDGGA